MGLGATGPAETPPVKVGTAKHSIKTFAIVLSVALISSYADLHTYRPFRVCGHESTVTQNCHLLFRLYVPDACEVTIACQIVHEIKTSCHITYNDISNVCVSPIDGPK